MKTYIGSRGPLGCGVLVEDQSGVFRLPVRLDLLYHSSEFEWGYGGSGPAQLALAILADHIGDDTQAVELHQRFKQDVVAGWQGNHFRITGHDIDTWLRNAMRRQA